MSNSTDARRRQGGAVFALYRAIWQLLDGRRKPFAGAVVLLIGAQVVLLCIPYLSGRALDALQLRGTGGLGEAGHWLSLALLVAGASWLLHGPARFLERNAALTVRRRMSSKLLAKLFKLPLTWHESHHSGAMAHRVQQSTLALANFTQSQFIYLNSAVRLIGPLLALFWLQPIVGGAAVAGFGLIILSVAGFDRAMLRLAAQENDAERKYAAALVDSVGNVGTVYALRQSRAVSARLENKLLAAFVPLRKSIVLNEAKWFTVDLATRALNCGLIGLFVWLVARSSVGGAYSQTVLLGSLYMVWEYAQQAAGVIASIASHFQTFARQHADYAAAEVVREATTGEPPPLACPAVHWRKLSVRDLTYEHYSKCGSVNTLNGVSMALESGKRYALIGASGSGKSTLLRVLAGLYVAERVTFTVDDGPIHVMPAAAAQILRSTTTLIPQDAEIYEGTLAENLSLCDSAAGAPTPAGYSAALHTACASDFTDSLPLGLETVIAERGANFSGGQRHRVALARGVLAANGSALVLLDEPTACLDPATEERVYNNLFAAFTDACVISSIHRTELLGLFDEVLVMRNGQLVAQGSADELALTCAEFRQLTSRGKHESRSTALLINPTAGAKLHAVS